MRGGDVVCRWEIGDALDFVSGLVFFGCVSEKVQDSVFGAELLQCGQSLRTDTLERRERGE